MQSSQAVGFVSRLAVTGVLVFTALSFAPARSRLAKPPSNPASKPAFRDHRGPAPVQQLQPAAPGSLRHHAPAHRPLLRRQHPLRRLRERQQPPRRLPFRPGQGADQHSRAFGPAAQAARELQRPGDRARRRRPEPHALHRPAARLGRRDRPLRALRRDGFLQELPSASTCPRACRWNAGCSTASSTSRCGP